MRILTLVLLLSLLTFLGSANSRLVDGQPLRATVSIVGTRYCSAGDPDTFAVWLDLRIKYTNLTDVNLILDREIGKAWYGQKVARSLHDLADGLYESNPNIDWMPQDHLPVKPSLGRPDADFVILSPGESFESQAQPSVIAEYEGRKIPSVVTSGVHVFQMDLSAWDRPGNPSQFAKSWRKFGKLVTGTVVTQPLTITIPPNPAVEFNCQ